MGNNNVSSDNNDGVTLNDDVDGDDNDGDGGGNNGDGMMPS